MGLSYLPKQHLFLISTAPTPSLQERTFMWWMKLLKDSKTKCFYKDLAVVINMCYLL